MRALIIDDNRFDRELARRALVGLSLPAGPLEALEAGDWDEARELLSEQLFDLILLDFNLPDLNGLEILRELGEDHPPVVMLTDQNDLTTAVETLRAGARDYVPKSADWDGVLERVAARVLEHVELERQVVEHRKRLERHAQDLEEKVAARTAMVNAQAKEIEKLYLQAKAAARLKEEILANVSHEFRTPLNAVLGFTQLLARDLGTSASPEVLETLRTISQSGERLLRLVDTLLQLVRLRSGEERLVRSRFSLSVLVEKIRADSAVLEAGTDLRIEWRVLSPSNEIESDREKIRTIAYHLLSNAIKFTHEGSIDLSFAPTPGGGLILRVADSGIGLPPGLREVVFDEFRQADSSKARRYEGLGLGLSIVKRCVSLLQGEVHLQSVVGRGTVVEVDIPGPAQADTRSIPPGELP